MSIMSNHYDFVWEDKLDDGRPVVVHAVDYEGADPSVGLGEGCGIYAADGDGIYENGLATNEVEINEAEYYRFEEIALEMYHSGDNDYPAAWPEAGHE